MAVDDTYTYPGSNGVLINRFGINTAEELASVVDTITKYRMVTAFDIARNHTGFERLRVIHEHLFQDVFDWAGQLRTVNTANGALVHCLAPYLEENLTTFERERLVHETELGTAPSKDEVLRHVAWTWGELTMLHPFRDGNTRSQGVWVDVELSSRGYTLDWPAVDQDHLNDLRMHAARDMDPEPLATYLDIMTRPEPRPTPSTFPRLDAELKALGLITSEEPSRDIPIIER